MRLLVVEDEIRIAQAIKKALSLHHYAVDTVQDGDAGLAAALDPDYDLVILDRALPGTICGLEVCRQLRLAGINVPVLMLTALDEVDDRVAGLRAGADDYLVKPFSMEELVARVEVLLRRPAQLLGTKLQLAGLELNVNTYQVTRRQVLISLSPREFKLLSYLLYNQEHILSKEKIISHVWDGDTLIMPNTVETYIGYLRKKIDRPFPAEPPLIHTIRGFGYRLGAR